MHLLSCVLLRHEGYVAALNVGSIAIRSPRNVFIGDKRHMMCFV
jgi:hypothetical protein